MNRAGAATHACQDSAATVFRWLVFALVTALLFAHGCHGDGDHELFTSGMATFGSGEGETER